jgi:hypothetical protein
VGITDKNFKNQIPAFEVHDATGDNIRQEPIPYRLRGKPLANYVDQAINPEDTLLGDRWLCRGGGAFVVAPSGMGKSVWSIQAAIKWSIGDRVFGIKPARPLKVLILQAEDDEGDIIEMSRIATHLEISGKRFEQFETNVWMEPLNHLSGNGFIQALNSCLEQWSADLVIINPYTSYLGADIKDDGANNIFLRNWLNPVLTKHRCAALLIHHTPKTNFRDTSEWKLSDWMYSGAGAACLTNWARAYLAIDPTKVYGCYKFIAAKRGKRIGWSGEWQQHFSHSKEDGKLLWVPSTQEEILASTSKQTKSAEDLLPFIPMVGSDPISMSEVIETAKGVIGDNYARKFVKELVILGKVLPSTRKPDKGKSIEVYVRK